MRVRRQAKRLGVAVKKLHRGELGPPLRTVAAKHGISHETVRRYRRKFGTPRADPPAPLWEVGAVDEDGDPRWIIIGFIEQLEEFLERLPEPGERIEHPDGAAYVVMPEPDSSGWPNRVFSPWDTSPWDPT
jgi:hypothetical protein